jgi:hypothetical protein
LGRSVVSVGKEVRTGRKQRWRFFWVIDVINASENS